MTGQESTIEETRDALAKGNWTEVVVANVAVGVFDYYIRKNFGRQLPLDSVPSISDALAT